MQAALKGRSIWAERRNKADYLQSRGLSVGRGRLLLKFDSDDTKHWNDSIVAANNVSPASFLSAPCGCSMDVQGDYDPCDASGFIRINAVRSDSPHPLKFFLSFFFIFLSKSILSMRFWWIVLPFSSPSAPSTGWGNTIVCRDFPAQRSELLTPSKPSSIHWRVQKLVVVFTGPFVNFCLNIFF